MTPKPTSVQSAPWRKRIAVISRWLHIYLSMVSFAVVLFFATTGLTLNHADKFGDHARVARKTGLIAPAAMRAGAEPDTLAIAEQLRRDQNLRGTVSDVRTDTDQVSLSFRAAGYSADVFVDRPSGKYQVVETRNGAIATLNDLHRGVTTGKAWSWVIDLSAGLLVLVSLTGLILLFFVYKRRTSGYVLAAVAAAVAFLIARSFAM